jgi:hypothetical protein
MKYRLIEPPAHAPWHALMRNHVGALVGTNDLGDLVLDLLTGSLTPTTYKNYGTGIVTIHIFCDEEGITPLHATAADMPRFTSWLARAGTVVACSLQPCFSTINKNKSRSPQGARGTGTTSSGGTSRTRHAATTHRRPRHSRTNPSTHRTTNATIRPPTLSRASPAAGHPRTHQDPPRNSRSLH